MLFGVSCCHAAQKGSQYCSALIVKAGEKGQNDAVV